MYLIKYSQYYIELGVSNMVWRLALRLPGGEPNWLVFS